MGMVRNGLAVGLNDLSGFSHPSDPMISCWGCMGAKWPNVEQQHNAFHLLLLEEGFGRAACKPAAKQGGPLTGRVFALILFSFICCQGS